MTHQPRILFIDAYDSFSANITALLRLLLPVHIDEIKIDTPIAQTFSRSEETFLQGYHAIVLGPGPGNPLDDADVGLYKSVWRIAEKHSIPVLGICLGFQSLCVRYGWAIERLEIPCHGHAKVIEHEGRGVFEGIAQLEATCYNSLGVRLWKSGGSTADSRPRTPDSGYESKPMSSRTSFEINEASSYTKTELSVLAWDDEGWVQSVQHESLPFCGLQFHPESCKSNDACPDLIKKWWSIVTEHNDATRPILYTSIPPSPELHTRPVTQISRQPILDVLDQLCPPSTDKVDYRTLQSSATRAQIAHLCHQLSHLERLCMLESSKKGRYSIYAVTDSSTWTLEYARGILKIISDATSSPFSQPATAHQAMDLVETFMATRIATNGPHDSPFWGGLIGYFSYELGLDLLQISDTLDSGMLPREVPDYSLTWISRSIVVDKETGTVYIQSLLPNDTTFLTSTLDRITALTNTPALDPPTLDLSSTKISLPSHTTYTSQINTCLAQLHDGNSYELCLTTPATLHLDSSLKPFSLHQHLLSHNPSTYSALLTLPSVTIHSLSPEQFLSWPRPTLSSSDTKLSMAPMKGTLAKRPGMTRADAQRELGTRKEEAENLMIVDLIRHDLNRALREDGAEGVKVEVERLFELVEAETVWQLISCIAGTVPAPIHLPAIEDDQCRESPLLEQRKRTLKHAMKALKTTLPPGSMTGAPKKRSCEILRGLERRNRGVYAGVLGYFDVGGGGCWSVAIRCAFSATPKRAEQMREWHVAAGGAITVLSDVEGEWEEMRVKMESVLKVFKQ